MFDPWAECDRLGIEIIRAPMGGARGYTDGHSKIWVHDTLTQREELSTLTHEIVHIMRADCGKQDAETENLVRCVTARWLVPWATLVSAWRQGAPLEQVAAEFGVTVDVVMDRLNHATAGELATLESVCVSLAA